MAHYFRKVSVTDKNGRPVAHKFIAADTETDVLKRADKQYVRYAALYHDHYIFITRVHAVDFM